MEKKCFVGSQPSTRDLYMSFIAFFCCCCQHFINMYFVKRIFFIVAIYP